MNRVEIKARAKKFAFSNKWNIWMPIIVVGVISGVIGGILGALGFGPEITTTADGITRTTYSSNAGAIISSIFEIALLPLTVGLNYYIISLVRGKKTRNKRFIF